MFRYNDQLALPGNNRRVHTSAIQPHRGHSSPFELFDSMMADFDHRTFDMMSGLGLGLGAMTTHSVFGGPSSFGSVLDMQGLPQGSYSSSVMLMSSSTGFDGRQHVVEKYAASQVGNSATRTREVQQAYSSSRSGVDKMALERHVGERARKLVRERDRKTGQETSTDLYKGITEAEAEQFDRDFQAVHHTLPQHANLADHARALQGPAGSAALGGRRGIADRGQPAAPGRRGSGGGPQPCQLAVGMGGRSEEPRHHYQQQGASGRYVRQTVADDDQRSERTRSSADTHAVLDRAVRQPAGNVYAEQQPQQRDPHGSGRQVFRQQQQQGRQQQRVASSGQGAETGPDGYRNVRID